MIETKPRINCDNRGQLFRATWLSSARCSETFRRTTERVECSAKRTWQRLRAGLNLPDPDPELANEFNVHFTSVGARAAAESKRLASANNLPAYESPSAEIILDQDKFRFRTVSTFEIRKM